MSLIAKRLKQTRSASERGRLQSLLVAGGIALVCTVLDYLPEIGYFFFGNILVSLFLYFLFQIIEDVTMTRRQVCEGATLYMEPSSLGSVCGIR